MKRELTNQSKMEQKNLPSLQLDKFQVGRKGPRMILNDWNTRVINDLGKCLRAFTIAWCQFKMIIAIL